MLTRKESERIIRQNSKEKQEKRTITYEKTECILPWSRIAYSGQDQSGTENYLSGQCCKRQ